MSNSLASGHLTLYQYVGTGIYSRINKITMHCTLSTQKFIMISDLKSDNYQMILINDIQDVQIDKKQNDKLNKYYFYIKTSTK